jgi:hypothetical protein
VPVATPAKPIATATPNRQPERTPNPCKPNNPGCDR